MTVRSAPSPSRDRLVRMNPLVRLLRRLVHGAPIIVVSGLPRSGTSMLMAMLDAGGLKMMTDGLRAADEDNPRGYYELEPVKDLATAHEKPWLHQARGKGIKVVSTLLKELPRTHNYKVVFLRRDLDEVLASQARMLERRSKRNHVDDTRLRALFEDELWRADYLLEHSSHFEHLYVDYSHCVANPAEQARRIAAFVGAGLDVDAMAGVVDASLYRNRTKAG